jgi:hypothetical protein
MRQQSVAWERVAEVRQAAQGWLRAGAIDESTAHAIRDMFPDPCVTPSVVWRVLTACAVATIVLSDRPGGRRVHARRAGRRGKGLCRRRREIRRRRREREVLTRHLRRWNRSWEARRRPSKPPLR